MFKDYFYDLQFDTYMHPETLCLIRGEDMPEELIPSEVELSVYDSMALAFVCRNITYNYAAREWQPVEEVREYVEEVREYIARWNAKYSGRAND